MNKEDILSKIHDLFEYRRLPEMIENRGCDQGFVNKKLVELQYDIFLYDSVLETQFAPDIQLLGRYWEKIRSHLLNLGYTENETDEYLSQIAIYATNELSTREGIRLSQLPIRYFYYYKSCDVRLMRRLINDQAPGVRLADNGIKWLVFDWVTEINDDVTDLDEDIPTFNGNRYLDALRMKGYLRTKGEYVDFLDGLGRQADKCLEMDGDFQWIHKDIVEQISLTKQLIDTHEQYASYGDFPFRTAEFSQADG